jgi:hypothetical protein
MIGRKVPRAFACVGNDLSLAPTGAVGSDPDKVVGEDAFDYGRVVGGDRFSPLALAVFDEFSVGVVRGFAAGDDDDEAEEKTKVWVSRRL